MGISSLSPEEKEAVVCLYYARLKSDDPRYKGKYTNSLKLLSHKYGKKFRTLTNWKDLFDAQFDNGRAGWHQIPIENQNRFLTEIYEKYKDMPISQLQELANSIITEANSSDIPFYVIKLRDEKSVMASKTPGNTIEIENLMLKANITVGQPVFVSHGGNQPPWPTGFCGIGVVIKAPFDIGYITAKNGVAKGTSTFL